MYRTFATALLIKSVAVLPPGFANSSKRVILAQKTHKTDTDTVIARTEIVAVLCTRAG